MTDKGICKKCFKQFECQKAKYKIKLFCSRDCYVNWMKKPVVIATEAKVVPQVKQSSNFMNFMKRMLRCF